MKVKYLKKILNNFDDDLEIITDIQEGVGIVMNSIKEIRLGTVPKFLVLTHEQKNKNNWLDPDTIKLEEVQDVNIQP